MPCGCSSGVRPATGEQSLVATSHKSIAFTIEGNPVAKGRPRFAKFGGFVRTYTPKKTERYEDIVRWHALEARNAAGLVMLDAVPLRLQVRCYLSVPTSWSKVKTQRALAGAIRPTGKPDWDNFAKLISDALNGVIYRDDSAIWEATVRKVYDAKARTEVILSWDHGDELAAKPRAGPVQPTLEENPF